jgi:hypothetical protein
MDDPPVDASWSAGTVRAPDVSPPVDHRVPFGWPAVAIPHDPGLSALELRWPAGNSTAPARPADLRITVARDDREEKTVLAVAARSGRPLGRLDIRYADPHQRFGLALDAERVAIARAEGIALRVARGTSPLWIFAGGPERHRPGLVGGAAGGPAALFDRLASLDSVQSFGWMEGCVLDGLLDLADALPAHAGRVNAAIDDHLAHYLADGRLRYEDPRGRPADGRFYGIEATLPVAAIARRHPGHPVIDLAIDFWRSTMDGEGCARDGRTTAEGCYTVAYPMAVIAAHRRSAELADLAVAQLTTRRDRLWAGDCLFQRRLPDGELAYPDWARGHAWYLLGFLRTAAALRGFLGSADIAPLLAEARRCARLLLDRQGPSGLWPCFLGMPATGDETCGSAGIAAALALGHHLGCLGPPAAAAARRAWVALRAALSPDGWLGGGSQANKGGPALQRGGYRVLSGVGTGLMGQLGAILTRIG